MVGVSLADIKCEVIQLLEMSCLMSYCVVVVPIVTCLKFSGTSLKMYQGVIKASSLYVHLSIHSMRIISYKMLCSRPDMIVCKEHSS